MDEINVLMTEISEGNFSHIDTLIDTLLGVEKEEAVAIIQNLHEFVDVQPYDEEAKSFMTLLLDSFWNFHQSTITINEQADFSKAHHEVEKAAKQFHKLGLNYLNKLATGFQIYYSAMIDIQSLNINAGIKKIEDARQYFKSMDRYEKYYGWKIGFMEGQGYYMSGVSYLMKLDYENANVFVEKAINITKHVARKYFEENSHDFNYFMGIAYLYHTFRDFFLHLEELNRFNFEHFDYVEESELMEGTVKATEFFSKISEQDEDVISSLKLLKGLHLITETIFKIGKSMYSLLNGKSEVAVLETFSLKKNIKNAKRFFMEVRDDNMVIFLKFVDRAERQIINLDRFIKTKNDYTIKESEPLVIVNPVRELIGKGKTDKALDLFLGKILDYDIFIAVTLLKSRLSMLNNDKLKGTISSENYTVGVTNINESILKILKEMQ